MSGSVEKISDPGLRQFASSKSAKGQQTIIVELGSSPPPLELRPGTPRRLHRQTRAVPLADVEGHAEEMDQLESDLKKIRLAEEPIRLDAAQAFVLTVTPEQLREISHHPLVGDIRPNRVHRT